MAACWVAAMLGLVLTRTLPPGAVDPADAFDTKYVALGDAHCYTASLPNAWFHALTGSVTVRTSTQSAPLDVGVLTSIEAVDPV